MAYNKYLSMLANGWVVSCRTGSNVEGERDFARARLAICLPSLLVQDVFLDTHRARLLCDIDGSGDIR